MRFTTILLAAALSASAQVTYKVQVATNSGSRIIEFPAEKYVAAVLAGESSTFQSDEALKAMAVAARTYAARLRGRHAAEGFDFCATTHCQRVEIGHIPDRLINAAAATEGEMLWFSGELAFAVYTRDCGGITESASSVWPDIQALYLLAHADSYCARHGAQAWSWKASPVQIAAALRHSNLECPTGLHRIIVRSRSASGRAQTLELEGNSNVVIDASSFRFAVGRELGWNTIRSDLYQIDDAAAITFTGKGQGHGVGLCQNGADEMGIEGRSYREILAFYYPGTSVSRLATGFAWKRLGGEGVTVLTEHPDDDALVLKFAESARRSAENRLHLSAPPAVTVRVYPNIDAFRNATGEPGWVAAHSRGSIIDLQPSSILNRTGSLKSLLYHEMLHVTIEAHAAPGLPVWFREGLVEYLQNGFVVGTRPRTVGDAGVRQRQSRAQAETAYADAAGQVAELVRRYGETEVLGWIERGLPAEVKNSSANSAVTNSR